MPALPLLQRTYTGLLDDVMIRFSSEFIRDDFFNKTIAKNVFFGGGLYFNDGYLANHPVARRALRHEDGLLRRMMATGFIRILTRAKNGDDLAEVPQRLANEKNEEYQRLVSSPEWPEFSKLLRRLGRAAFFNNTFRNWPAFDMSVGYTRLMERVFAADFHTLGLRHVSADAFKRIRDGFLARNPHLSGPRDKLEKASREIVGEHSSNYRAAMHEVMMLGNQAYHYNFGLALTSEDPNRVSVDTTINAAFDDLLLTRDVVRDQLDAIPLMRIPRQFPMENGDLFMPFLDPSTDVGEAKLEYLGALREVLDSDLRDLTTATKRIVEASALYRERIFELLARRFGEAIRDQMPDEAFKVGVATFSSGTNEAGKETVALALSVHDDDEGRGRQFLIERFNLKDGSDRFDREHEHLIRFGDIRSEIASLAFNPDAAESFTADLPRMGPAHRP